MRHIRRAREHLWNCCRVVSFVHRSNRHGPERLSPADQAARARRAAELGRAAHDPDGAIVRIEGNKWRNFECECLIQTAKSRRREEIALFSLRAFAPSR